MKTLFLLLIISQALHSIEEYLFELWVVFLPARFVSGLISNNLTLGFVVINASVVLLGLWCYLFPVRKSWRSIYIVMWGWVLLESANAIGHFLFALQQGGYFPGLVTAIPLLIFSCLLLKQLILNTEDNVETNSE